MPDPKIQERLMMWLIISAIVVIVAIVGYVAHKRQLKKKNQVPRSMYPMW